MSNEFFTSSSIPGTGAQGSSAAIRAEFEQLVAAFDKLPVLAGNAGEIVSINGTGTALENSTYKISDFVTLAAPGVLPALDGSLLTNLNAALFGTVSVAGGGTGATTLEGAQTALGIDLKANSLNATLTGAPVAPTPAPADDSTRIATTEYVNTALDAFSVSVGAVVQGSALPLINGASALAGTAPAVSREDHVHPRDTTKANLASPTFTGVVTLPVVAGGDNSAAAVYSSWVRTYVGAYAMPTSQVTGLDAALAARAALAGATFSGAVNVPTLTLGDNSTKAVNSAYLESWKTTLPGGVAVSNTDPLMNGSAYEGVSSDASRVDHVHPSDTSKQDVVSGVSSIEIGYLDGVTSAIQTQLNAKQNADPTLTALAGLATGGNKLAYSTGVNVFAETSLTSFARTLLDDADAAAARATLGAVTALEAWPVGSVYTSVTATSPATLFGGTWAAFGAGRVLVGIDAGQPEFDTVEETGGAKTHTLTTTEMPSHTHTLSNVTSYTATSVDTAPWAAQGDPSPNAGGVPPMAAATGGGGAHNNLQPYIVCYFWKRTA